MLTPLFLAIANLNKECRALIKEVDDVQSSIASSDPLADLVWDECDRRKAHAVEDLERKICEVAGIPYHGWAANVHRCARERNDRQGMDMAYALNEGEHNSCSPYHQLMSAMLWQAPTAYRDLF